MAVEEYKQVIVVRTDLSMSKGKLAAQVAHAAVSCVLEALKRHRDWIDEWIRQGQKKVILRVNSLEELLSVYNEAEKKGLPVSLIADAGRTELEPGTITCVGIGPAPTKIVDSITGRLKLL